MTGMEQRGRILLLTEIGGTVKFPSGIVELFETHTANKRDPTIQLTIVHFNQLSTPGHIAWYNSPLGSLDSITGDPRSRRNIDNRTEMNPQGPIVTTIPESKNTRN